VKASKFTKNQLLKLVNAGLNLNTIVQEKVLQTNARFMDHASKARDVNVETLLCCLPPLRYAPVQTWVWKYSMHCSSSIGDQV